MFKPKFAAVCHWAEALAHKAKNILRHVASSQNDQHDGLYNAEMAALAGQLKEKCEYELNDLRRQLLSQPVETVLENSYEWVVKNAMVQMFDGIHYVDAGICPEHLREILALEHPLSELYRHYLEDFFCGDLEDFLWQNLYDFGDELLSEYDDGEDDCCCCNHNRFVIGCFAAAVMLNIAAKFVSRVKK